jgi:RsiW-degrading membrane proteinase PrsW (M82 family)
MDGIIYATAVGIGFATYQNFHELSGTENTVYIAVGATNAVVTTLAHACFAAVMGYVLGRARFAAIKNPRHTITLVAGLLIAAGLNGNFNLLESRIVQDGVEVEPWRAVALAAIFAAVVFAAVFALMKRLLAISPHRKD